MKKRLLASLLSATILLSMTPMAFADEETAGEPAALSTQEEVAVQAEEQTGTTSTVEDIDNTEWTFVKSENSVTMKQSDAEQVQFTATLDNGVLTISGKGALPVLNASTDDASSGTFTGYPWYAWKDSITEIKIGDGVTGVGAKSFITYPNVTKVSLGKDVASIGAGAFAQLSGCNEFIVDHDNTAFTAEDGILYSKEITKLYYYPITKTGEEFTVPDTVTELGYNAICLNKNLKTITFSGDQPLTLQFGSLFGNSALTTVNLNRDNIEFSTMVFNRDTSLQVVYCKNSDVKVKANKLVGDAQSNAVALLMGGQAGLKTDDGYLYAYDREDAIICGYNGNDTVLTIPSKLNDVSVTSIGANAFANMDGKRSITAITIPSTVTSIGKSAFLGWKDASKYDSTLINVTILGTNVEVGSMAFARHGNLRIDMTAVSDLEAEKNAFHNVSKIIVSKSSQEDVRIALAENSALNDATRIYVTTDDKNAFYWYYQDNEWKTVSSVVFTPDPDPQGLIYQVTYLEKDGKTTATAAITGYNKPADSQATELIIPKTLPFFDAEQNEVQAKVVSMTGLSGTSSAHVKNGIKTLRIEADLDNLDIKVVYWDDLTTLYISGSVGNIINCFTGCDNLRSVYFANQENVSFGPSAFGAMPKLDVVDLSGVKNVTMYALPKTAYGKSITRFFDGTSGADRVTLVYVGSDEVYQSINDGVTFEDKTTLSGFNFTNTATGRNIVAVTNGGTFTQEPTGVTALAVPVKEGYLFAGWYANAQFTEESKLDAAAVPETGKIYYAKWVECNHTNREYTADNAGAIYARCKDCGSACGSATLTLPENLVYDGQPKEATVAYSNDWTAEKNLVVKYNGEETAPTDAGTYTVKIAVGDVEATLPMTITKATPTITITPDKETLTGSGTVTLTVEKPEDGEVSVTCDKTDVKVTPNKEDGTFIVTLPNATETYIFTATVKYEDNANYVNVDPVTCTVTVTYQSTSHGGGGSRNNSYAVSTPKADNGSVTVNNGATAKKGDTVTITVKPDAGYEIDKVTVTDSKGNSIALTDKGDGKFSFVMPDSKVDVKATFVKSEVQPDQPSKTTFVDVPSNSWYADAADFVAKRGLMSGVGENLFGGSQNTTRAMLMTILARMDGQDVTGGSTWYEKAMNWAKQTGVSDGTMPEKNITREQLATMLYSYAKLKGMDTTQGGMAVREFADYDSISSWAGQSMTWAVNEGILSGRGNNTLAPTAGATRAEMAVMLQQFVKLMEK